jgi:hypothetical protein
VTSVPTYATTNLTMFLVYLAAILLTVRLIQADPVPGTREYWLTRPYRWKSVLIAKAMFIAVCVNIPILLARIAIIVLDGFPLPSNLWGLLWTQVLMALQLLVPAAALAAVTASLTPFIFTAVSLLATRTLVQAFIPLRRSGVFQTEWPLNYGWTRTAAQGLILVTVGILLVYIQYRYRRTTLSRILGVGAVALVLVVYVWMPMSFAMDVQSRIWHNAEASSIQAGIVPPADKFVAEKGTFSVTLELPVELKGLPKEVVALPIWFRVRIEGPDHQSIGRESANYTQYDSADLHSWKTKTEVPTSFLESERGKPLMLHASVFFSLFRKDRTVSVLFATNRWLDIPGGFRCFNGFFQHCEKASTLPSPLVTAFLGGMNFVWFRPGSRSPLETSMVLNPVESSNNALNRGGAAVTEVTVWEPVADLRREIEIQNFPLTDYVDIER